MVSVYCARGMTGRVKEDVVKEAKKDKALLEYYGITVLCPVLKEHVVPTKAILQSDISHMNIYWPQDKKMIQEANLVLDMTPHMNSEGVKHEIGLCRYAYWKKVIRVFPKGQMPAPSSVAFYEDDYICDNLLDAIIEIHRTHGTWLKRFIWRVKLYRRCISHHYWLKLKFWFQ